jgi:hypothetical protein
MLRRGTQCFISPRWAPPRGERSPRLARRVSDASLLALAQAFPRWRGDGAKHRFMRQFLVAERAPFSPVATTAPAGREIILAR